LRIWQKILLILAVPILFQIVFVAILAVMLFHTEHVSDQFARSKRVMLSFDAA